VAASGHRNLFVLGQSASPNPGGMSGSQANAGARLLSSRHAQVVRTAKLVCRFARRENMRAGGRG
jgi:hypothetical protein